MNLEAALSFYRLQMASLICNKRVRATDRRIDRTCINCAMECGEEVMKSMGIIKKKGNNKKAGLAH